MEGKLANIDFDELKEISKNFQQKPKPNFGGLSSLERAQQEVNFGFPEKSKTKSSVAKVDLKKDNLSKTGLSHELKIKINVASPKIKKYVGKAKPSQKNLVQTEDIEKLVSQGEFSSRSISFIPYKSGLLNASEALDKINNDFKNFKLLEENFLTEENISFILSKIEKIYDISSSQKMTLKDFYLSIQKEILNAKSHRQKAAESLSKIKTKAFREKLSQELQRMMKPNGDLYTYYVNFKLIDEEYKKRFLLRILSIDSYIMKKIKEIISFNQNDISFRFDEILEFVSVISTRNILMENFHHEIEQLAEQKKEIDNLKDEALKLEAEISKLAQVFGRSGKYGRSIERASNITEKLKKDYSLNISQIIEMPMTKIQKIILSLDTGNYITLKRVNDELKTISSKELETKCLEIYNNTQKQAIK